ncbi:MAG: hypothetical protein ABJA66_06270 [Actinomycetota bacterium]
MCCNAFWKKVIVFCLTFGLGTFVSNAFISKELSSENQKTVNNSVSNEVNCIPIDSSLKYENLAAKEEKDLFAINETPKSEVKKTATDKKTLKDNQAKQKNIAESKEQFYNQSKDSAEYKVLLHKEQCFEAQEQK